MPQDTDFDPFDFMDDEPEGGGSYDIEDIDDLYYLDYDDGYDYVEYEFHGTGDTGGNA